MDASWVLWPVAVLMAFLVAALVRWSSETRTVVAASVVVFLLAMMVAMFVATAIYFSRPGTVSFVLGLWVAAVLMAGSVFPVFALILREARDRERRGTDYSPRRLAYPAVLAVTVTALVLAGELLMGRSFELASGSAGTARGWAALVGTIASPWFLFPMSLEMSLTLFWLRPRLPGMLAATLGVQSAMMFFAPPALPYEPWLLASGLLTGVAMAGLLGFLLRSAYRGAPFERNVRGYIVRFLLVSAVMGVGLALWVSDDLLAVFALATVLEMAIFFTAVVVPESFSTPAVGPPDGGSPLRAGEGSATP
jgi:hypothetical protein